jgi:hypothetical protein
VVSNVSYTLYSVRLLLAAIFLFWGIDVKKASKVKLVKICGIVVCYLLNKDTVTTAL